MSFKEIQMVISQQNLNLEREYSAFSYFDFFRYKSYRVKIFERLFVQCVWFCFCSFDELKMQMHWEQKMQTHIGKCWVIIFKECTAC